jgi:DNA-binding NarL/FixJ family response regulator
VTLVFQRILIADDSAPVRRAVCTYLSGRSLHVCGEAEDGLETIQRARLLKPDLILLDLAMPKLNGLEAALILKREMPDIRIVLFTMYTEAISRSLSAKLRWVDAVIAKSDGISSLADCVQGLMA